MRGAPRTAIDHHNNSTHMIRTPGYELSSTWTQWRHENIGFGARANLSAYMITSAASCDANGLARLEPPWARRDLLRDLRDAIDGSLHPRPRARAGMQTAINSVAQVS